MGRWLTATVLALQVGGTLRADTVTLAESPRPGECARITMNMKLSGTMVVVQAGKASTLNLAPPAGAKSREPGPNVAGALRAKAPRAYAGPRRPIQVDAAPPPRALR